MKRKKVRGVRVDVNGEVKLLWKLKKKWGGGGGRLGVGLGGEQGGCEWRSEAFVKIQKKIFFFFLGGGGGGRGSGQGGGGSGWGVSGWMGTENRSFCENSKDFFFWGGRVWGGGGGNRVDVNGEVRLL